MRTTLLLGGRGQVGTAFREILDDAFSPDRSSFDLAVASADDIAALVLDKGANLIINCAAYTAVEQAELEEDKARAVNAFAVGRLAEVSSDLRIPLVTYSTDYVFDGLATVPYLESDSPHPINAYGRSKVAGEILALEANPRTLLIRTSWVISSAPSSFTTRIVDAVVRGDKVSVVDDRRGSPTVADDLARGTLTALNEGVEGLLHLSNDGDASWYELARATVEAAGLDPGQVTPRATDDVETRVDRPRYTVLGSERVSPLGLDPLPHWNDALASVVRTNP